MRISAWSSDVCSSDLFAHWFAGASALTRTRIAGALLVAPPDLGRLRHKHGALSFADSPAFTSRTPMIVVASDNDPYAKTAQVWRLARRWDARFVNAGRSEEHTSELQSLIRISYAV